jgi:hypothetical protein
MTLYKIVRTPFLLCLGAFLTIIAGMYSIIEIIKMYGK